MNQNLFQINNNYGVVTDEKGNISIVSKESQEYELKDILIKENELEELDSKLNTDKKALSKVKRNVIMGEIGSALTIVDEIFLYCVFHSRVSQTFLFVAMAIFYLVAEWLVTDSCGTRIGNFISTKKLKKSIKKLEDRKLELVSELQKMKEETKYQSHHESEIDWLNNGEVKYSFTGKTMNRDESDKPTEVKVLRLVDDGMKK